MKQYKEFCPNCNKVTLHKKIAYSMKKCLVCRGAYKPRDVGGYQHISRSLSYLRGENELYKRNKDLNTDRVLEEYNKGKKSVNELILIFNFKGRNAFYVFLEKNNCKLRRG